MHFSDLLLKLLSTFFHEADFYGTLGEEHSTQTVVLYMQYLQFVKSPV